MIKGGSPVADQSLAGPGTGFLACFPSIVTASHKVYVHMLRLYNVMNWYRMSVRGTSSRGAKPGHQGSGCYVQATCLKFLLTFKHV